MLERCFKKINESAEKHRIFLIYSLIFFVTYALFMHDFIQSDHVAAYAISDGVTLQNLGNHLSSGRYMNFVLDLCYCLLRVVNVTHVSNRWVLQLILIFFCALTAERLTKLFAPLFSDKKLFLVLLVLLNFMNPYFVESFAYAGAELGLGILFVELAVEKFVGKIYIISGILLFCGISVYQSYIALFMIWLVTYIYMANAEQKLQAVIRKYFSACVLAGIVAVVNIGIGKIALITNVIDAEIKEVQVGTNLFEKLKIILVIMFRGTVELYHFCPSYFLFGGCLFIGVLAACYVLKKCKSVWEVLHLCIVGAMLILFPYAIAVVMPDIWMPPRILWVIFASYSAIILICLQTVYESKMLRKIVIVLAGILILAVYFGTVTAVLDSFVSKALDRYNMRMIQAEIEEYEAETGCKIKEISVGRADNIQLYYEEAKHFDYQNGMYFTKTYYDRWADVTFLNRVNNTNYIRVNMSDEDRERLFGEAEVSANVFNSSEQLVFEGDRMYWLIF